MIRHLYCVKNCSSNNGVGGTISRIPLCIILGIKLALKTILAGCKKNVIRLFKYLRNCATFRSSLNFSFSSKTAKIVPLI